MTDSASDDRLVAAEKRPRVIVLADDALTAIEVAETIESSGAHLIGTAATSGDAVRLATGTRPDVAVIDLHLKTRGGGLSAAEAIRKCSAAAVLFIAGSADGDTIRRVHAFNGSAPLFKPLRYRELPEAILRALASARGRDTPME